MIQDNKGEVHFTFKGWPLGCLFIFLCTACNTKYEAVNFTKQFQQIDSIKPLLKNGDLIVRNGMDDISRTTRSFNRKDTSFSHCGIIVKENDTLFVYHALGGSFNPAQCLMRQPIKNFCNPAQNDKFAVYRYKMNDQQIDSLQKIVRRYYTQKLPFDMFFNFYTDDKMYCAEFVFKSYNQALNGALTHYLHTEQKPLFVSIDDLYLNKFSVLIKRVEFFK